MRLRASRAMSNRGWRAARAGMKAEATVPAVDRMTMGVTSRISVRRDGLGNSSAAGAVGVASPAPVSAGAPGASRASGSGWVSSTA